MGESEITAVEKVEGKLQTSVPAEGGGRLAGQPGKGLPKGSREESALTRDLLHGFLLLEG